jgi:hypothetical protein
MPWVDDTLEAEAEQATLNPVTFRNAKDTWVRQSTPSTNYNQDKRLGVATSAYAFLYFGCRFDAGATIHSATLRLYTHGAWGTTPTLTVRRVSQLVSMARTTWNNQPPVTGTGVSITKSSNAIGHEWAFDVTAMIQAVADGSAWHGFRIESDATAIKYLRSAQALALRPTLEIVWSEAPHAPTTLSPSGGRAVSSGAPVLRFDFTDELGATGLQAVRVQVDPNGNWTDPAFDSLTFETDEPEFDLAADATGRDVSLTTTLNSTTATAPVGTFVTADVGQEVSGPNVPLGVTIASRQSDTQVTLSAAATATGTATHVVERMYLGLANGAETRWRVQVQDTAGLWSPWSDAVRFRRDNKGTLTITNPGAPPNDFVSEWTPPILWSLTGETQTAWRVLVHLIDGERAEQVHDSGRRKGTETSYTLPKGVIEDESRYRVTVRIWDSKDREATPGDPPFTSASQDFTFAEDATVDPVSGLTATNLTPRPWVQLEWTRATAPDSFTVLRNGKVIETGIDPVDVLVSAGVYRWTDKDAAPRKSHTWRVQAVVNRKASANNPGVTLTVGSTGVWLTDPDSGLDVFLAEGQVNGLQMVDQADVHVPLGSSRSIKITQGMRGYEGNVTGLVMNYAGFTTEQWVDRLLKIKERPSNILILTTQHETFRCAVGNITVSPADEVKGEARLVSFDVWQAANLSFRARL